MRAGTREVHNKLEKNRRAHLKECFESLKKQLPITPDEKKTSNLSILGAANRHIQVSRRQSSSELEILIFRLRFQFLKRKEREYEHEMERLAKEKIAAQSRITHLKRELTQWDIDFTKLIPEQTDITAVKTERSGETRVTNLFSRFLQLFVLLEAALDGSAKISQVYSNSTSPLVGIPTSAATVYSSSLGNVSRTSVNPRKFT